MNRKSITNFISIFLISFLFTSCLDLLGVSGSGEIVTEHRSVSDFNSVELLSYADVEIVKGDSFKVEVSDYENLIQYLSLKVVEKNLIISIDPITTILIRSKAKVMITMPDTLKSVSVIGSGDLIVNSAFKDLEFMTIPGSGNIEAKENLNIKKLTASILGSGNITAKGTVETLTTLISGSGNINFFELIAQNVDCSIPGSGNINVNVINTLKATISGSGNVFYMGNPSSVDQTITGSGVIAEK